jgi:hypothetical protein
MAKKKLSEIGIEQAQAVQLLQVHNQNLVFSGFVDVSTAIPDHTLNKAYISSVTGTVLGIAVNKGEVIKDTGTTFIAEKFYKTQNQYSFINYDQINLYISEINISSHIATDNIYIASFSISASTNNITIYFYKSGVYIGRVYYRDGINRFGQVLKIEATGGSGLSGYVVLKSGTISLSGLTTSFLSYKSFNLSYSPNINNSIVSTFRNDIASINLITGKNLIAHGLINDNISELFINAGFVLADNVYIGSFTINSTTKAITIYFYKAGALVARVLKNTGVSFFGEVLEIEEQNTSGIKGFIVVNSGTYAVSGLTNSYLTDQAFNINKNPNIDTFILHGLRTDVDILIGTPLNTIYINDTAANLRITELYIPDAASYGTMHLGQITIQQTQIRLFFYNSSNVLIAIGSYTGVDLGIYDKPFTIYKYQTSEILGYCILNRYGDIDYSLSGINYTINNTVVGDISKSPKLEALLTGDQIVLSGDSLFGILDETNVLQPFITNFTNVFTRNAGFGGCRMAWRTADGSNNYDKFTFIAVADALVTGNFSAMEAANTDLSGSFNIRLADLKKVDLTKKTTIFCNYVNNDLTGSSYVGNKWIKGQIITDFDKTTYLGAMNYGIYRILTAFPETTIVFLTEAWRYKTDKDGNSVPPYFYVNANLESSVKFRDDAIENWLRLGISYFDYLNFGGRNALNIGIMTIDGTHHSYLGYKQFSEKLSSIFLNKK